MKMKVFDQLHISGQNNNKTMGKDHPFEVSDSTAKEMMEKGLAYPEGMDRSDYSRGLAEFKDRGNAPKNKQRQIDQNKIIGGKAEGQNQPAPTVNKSGKGKGKDASADTGETSESSEA